MVECVILGGASEVSSDAAAILDVRTRLYRGTSSSRQLGCDALPTILQAVHMQAGFRLGTTSLALRLYARRINPEKCQAHAAA